MFDPLGFGEDIQFFIFKLTPQNEYLQCNWGNANCWDTREEALEVMEQLKKQFPHNEYEIQQGF